MKEVKSLSRWDAKKIKQFLVGKTAPEMEAISLKGDKVTLSGLKGKAVLLDFWTTWCPPCVADGPSLDKLHQKYGQDKLVIIGISVSEDRAVVEKFLEKHPHEYHIVLTTENELPAPYQLGTFPTYVVIETDGTVGAAVQGDKGFAELQKLLKRAGMETN